MNKERTGPCFYAGKIFDPSPPHRKALQTLRVHNRWSKTILWETKKKTTERAHLMRNAPAALGRFLPLDDDEAAAVDQRQADVSQQSTGQRQVTQTA